VLHEISLALQADELVIMADGRIAHHGACADAATHRALEQVFGERIHIQQVAGQWLSLPKL
jgi:iron complex transport system ATP-binding protein